MANTPQSNSLLANCFLWKIPLKHISYISFKELTEFLLSQTQLKSKKVIQVFHIKTKRMHYYSLETLSYLKLKITVSKECLAKDKFILDFIIIGSILLRLLKLKLIFMENNCCIQKMLAFKYKIYVQLIFDNKIWHRYWICEMSLLIGQYRSD